MVRAGVSSSIAGQRALLLGGAAAGAQLWRDADALGAVPGFAGQFAWLLP